MDSEVKESGSESSHHHGDDAQKTASSSSQLSQKTKNAFKSMKESFGRAKEKLMQNLGKSDRSRDEVMEEYVEMFREQKKVAGKIQDEVKNYVLNAKTSEKAFQDLSFALLAICGEEWKEYSTIETALQELRVVKLDYYKRLDEEILEGIKEYVLDYHALGQKINKMENKLIDFDASRHNLEHLKKSGNFEFEKLDKAQNRLKETWNEFEPLQKELIQEIPEFCDKRTKFFAGNIKTLFKVEKIYHTEAATRCEKLCEILSELDDAASTGRYDILRRKPTLAPPPDIVAEVDDDKKECKHKYPNSIEWQK